MNFIEALKNLYSYLFQGRCRRHDRQLSEVHVHGHYASTMPACIECHPEYRGQEIKAPARTLTSTQTVASAADFAEVEVG